MLSRVADCLYWMSRYLERAEHIARLLDVAFHTELDLAELTPPGYQAPWQSNLEILQQQAPPALL
ncbi:MAG: alpha-E domain-containing protein, partial [Gemmataceae bacterium]